MLTRLLAPVVTAVLLLNGVESDNPDQARSLAAEQLANLVDARSKILGSRDPKKLATASLGDPIILYGAESVYDTTFFAYEWAKPDDILKYAPWHRFCYPIKVDGEVVGSINVSEIGGEYEAAGGYGKGFGKLVAQLEALRASLGLTADKRLSIVDAQTSGGFYVVHNMTTVFQMAPADDRTMKHFGRVGEVGDASTFAAPENFSSRIRRDIGVARQRWIEAKAMNFKEED